MTYALVVDDHPIVLDVCRGVLRDLGVDEIVGARSVACAYRLYLRRRPDLMITDLTLRHDDLGGLALIQRIVARDADAKILVLTMHDDPTIVSRVLRAGALGLVLKDASSDELAQGCTRTLAGEPHLGHDLAMKVALLRAKSPSAPHAALTERETEILSLLGRGNSFEAIAAKLQISAKTVSNATALMRAKLKMTSLAELIRFAMHSGAGPSAL